jgi:hypothetical protein
VLFAPVTPAAQPRPMQASHMPNYDFVTVDDFWQLYSSWLPREESAGVNRDFFLEHFSYYCRAENGSLNQALASSAVSSGSSSAMAWSRASLVRALAVRSSCLSLAQAFSMGFRSGE